MALLDLPDELILNIIVLISDLYSTAPSASPLRFYNWTEQSARHLSSLDDVCRDLLNFSSTCSRLHSLTQPLVYEHISPRQWINRDAVGQHGASVKAIYGGGQASIAPLKSLPGLQAVTLHDMWEYSALFEGPIRQPDTPYANVRLLQCINCSLGLWALRELFAAFPNIEELWYEHGVYETMLNEPRKFWSASNYSTALKLLRSTLKTLVLTRETDALLNGHRAQHPAHVDLRDLECLEHLRIAEVFLFCRVQLQHHEIESLTDRLPKGLKTVAVFYDEPSQVRFNWEAPPGLSWRDAWPRWPLCIAQDKLNGSFRTLTSVTVLEKARPDPLKYGHLDDDHDSLKPEEEPNRRVEPPGFIAEACGDAKIQLLVLVNVGRRELR